MLPTLTDIFECQTYKCVSEEDSVNWASGVVWFPYDNTVMVDDMYT